MVSDPDGRLLSLLNCIQTKETGNHSHILLYYLVILAQKNILLTF
jgi:hypothetical protein